MQAGQQGQLAGAETSKSRKQTDGCLGDWEEGSDYVTLAKAGGRKGIVSAVLLR